MHLAKKLDLELREAKTTGDYQKYVTSRHQRTLISPFDRYRIRMFGNILKRQVSPGRVLDIGCNVGEMVKFYEQRFSGAVLCDLEEFMIKGARFANSYSSRLKFSCGNIINLPFKNNNFDTVIALGIIEHLPKSGQVQALREILRVARNNATIYISTPNKFSLAGLEGKFIEFFVRGYKWDAWDTDHRYLYYSWEFIRFLREFSDKAEIKKIYGTYFLPGSLIVRIPLLLQRFLGFISYSIDRTIGSLFPLRYLGFMTLVELKKR